MSADIECEPSLRHLERVLLMPLPKDPPLSVTRQICTSSVQGCNGNLKRFSPPLEISLASSATGPGCKSEMTSGVMAVRQSLAVTGHHPGGRQLLPVV